MNKIRVGIIGCSNIANEKHLPVLSEMEDVEVAALCDIIPERACAAQARFAPGADVYTDYHELLRDRSIDNVRVLTQNRLHAEIVIEALRAGKQVLCEKPLATNYSDAMRMVREAKKADRLLSVGYNHRFDPDAQYVKKEIESGALGRIYHAKARVIRRRGCPTHGKFLQREESGGGALIDVGTHAIDLVLWLMDNYRPAYVVGANYTAFRGQKGISNNWGDVNWDECDVEDSSFAFLVMKDGASVIIESSWLLNSLEKTGVRYAICGDAGGADTLAGNLRINHIVHDTQVITTPDFSPDGVAFTKNGVTATPAMQEQRAFIDACRGIRPLVTTGEQAAVVAHVIEGIYQSAQTGKAYYFE